MILVVSLVVCIARMYVFPGEAALFVLWPAELV